MPLEKSRVTLSRNDLKPDISNLFKFIKNAFYINGRFEKILTKDFFIVKKKYNKMWFFTNHTTICSVLIFIAFCQSLRFFMKFAEKNGRKIP